VWYSIEGLGKIQNGYISRYMLVTFKQEILDCNKQLLVKLLLVYGSCDVATNCETLV